MPANLSNYRSRLGLISNKHHAADEWQLCSNRNNALFDVSWTSLKNAHAIDSNKLAGIVGYKLDTA